MIKSQLPKGVDDSAKVISQLSENNAAVTSARVNVSGKDTIDLLKVRGDSISCFGI